MVKVLVRTSYFVLLLSLLGCMPEEEKKMSGYSGVIVAFGDSLTEGYGVAVEENYPALLQKKLQQDGYNYTVINEGISGELSVRAARRIDSIIAVHQPDIVIVETGINDGLYGRNLQRAEANIESILQRLAAENITVLLAGMKMFSNFGDDYARTFDAIYPRLAEKYDVNFMPFFLEDVALQAKFNIEDGLHPNGAGYKIITDNIYPYVKATIERQQQESHP